MESVEICYLQGGKYVLEQYYMLQEDKIDELYMMARREAHKCRLGQ